MQPYVTQKSPSTQQAQHFWFFPQVTVPQGLPFGPATWAPLDGASRHTSIPTEVAPYTTTGFASNLLAAGLPAAAMKSPPMGSAGSDWVTTVAEAPSVRGRYGPRYWARA